MIVILRWPAAGRSPTRHAIAALPFLVQEAHDAAQRAAAAAEEAAAEGGRRGPDGSAPSWMQQRSGGGGSAPPPVASVIMRADSSTLPPPRSLSTGGDSLLDDEDEWPELQPAGAARLKRGASSDADAASPLQELRRQADAVAVRGLWFILHLDPVLPADSEAAAAEAGRGSSSHAGGRSGGGGGEALLVCLYGPALWEHTLLERLGTSALLAAAGADAPAAGVAMAAAAAAGEGGSPGAPPAFTSPWARVHTITYGTLGPHPLQVRVCVRSLVGGQATRSAWPPRDEAVSPPHPASLPLLPAAPPGPAAAVPRSVCTTAVGLRRAAAGAADVAARACAAPHVVAPRGHRGCRIPCPCRRRLPRLLRRL